MVDSESGLYNFSSLFFYRNTKKTSTRLVYITCEVGNNNIYKTFHRIAMLASSNKRVCDVLELGEKKNTRNTRLKERCR